MGKSKYRRSRNHRNKPTGIPSEKELEQQDELVGNGCDDAIDSVIEKLQSCSSDDKECAATIISQMTDHMDFVSKLVENDAIKILGPLLLHPNLSVRHSVSGCLRNLAACGSHTIPEAMVSQDVMTPLVTLLKQYKGTWTPKKSSKSEIDSKTAIFLEICNLLWILCESSSIAVEIVNNNELIPILLPCLNVDIYGLETSLVILQCLHIITEDNPKAINELSKHPVSEMLHSFMSIVPIQPGHVLLRTLAASILLNINSGKIDNCGATTANIIMRLISDTLDIPVKSDLQRLTDAILILKSERKDRYREQDELQKKETTVTEIASTMEFTLQAKQVALEMLTNICCGDDVTDWDDNESSDASDDMIVESEDVPSVPVDLSLLSLNVSSEIHGFLVSNKMICKVVNQIFIPCKDTVDTLQENTLGKSSLKRLRTVRCRALLCINNIIPGLDIDEMNGREELFQLWKTLASIIFLQTDLSDSEQVEAVTCSVRAVLQKLAETNCSPLFHQLSEFDLHLLFNISVQSQNSGVKVNIVRSAATLGCILGNMKMANSAKLVTEIGTFLLETCTSKSSDVWVIGETLDAIIDVFSEDHMDAIACEISLVDKLQHILPILKTKIKQQRATFKQHQPIIMTAKENILAFIKYKNKHK